MKRIWSGWRKGIRQSWTVTAFHFRAWRSNPRIWITFGLAFVLCFLLSDKAMRYCQEHGTIMQLFEPFVWSFGDGNSILLASLLLIVLFADMPFLTAMTPYYLVRTRRATWLWGQIGYVFLATLIYLGFVLAATCLLCMSRSFAGNVWSETAAMLGYSGAGEQVALPALVKTLEMSTPYACTASIFLLMLLYSLFLVSVMLWLNLRKGSAAGIMGVFGISLYGFLLNPQTLQTIFRLPEKLMYRANVAVGWLSPLNHAAYHMHNFGHDLLPKLWHTYGLFGLGIALCTVASIRAIRRYSFHFRGTEET